MPITSRIHYPGPGVVVVKTGRGEVQAQVGDYQILLSSGWVVMTTADIDMIVAAVQGGKLDLVLVDPVTGAPV